MFSVCDCKYEHSTGRKRDEQLSRDGKGRSFPKVPNLLQYVSNGNYYGRIKVGGKTIRESLATHVWTKAKLRQHDILKKHQLPRVRLEDPYFRDAVEFYKQELARPDTPISPAPVRHPLH